ncbi:Kelch repeat-containing protein [Pendulispora albinea]|uniref:Galactose oxidase n=1 Tax=Pendulispora albinea TaxID=2741071 RepID=A0ABZ2LVG6_9BACT
MIASRCIAPVVAALFAFGACTAEQDLGHRPKNGERDGGPDANDGGGPGPMDGGDGSRDSGTDAKSDGRAPDGSPDASAPPSGKWTERAPMPTKRRALAAAFGANGKLYAMGGIASEVAGPLNTVEVYDPGADSWGTAPPLPTPRYALTAALGSDGRIYAIGGQADENTGTAPSTVVEAYAPGEGWVRAPSLPEGRIHAAAVAGKDGKIYVMGGQNPSRTNLATVVWYQPGAAAWTELSSPMTAPRTHLAATVGSDGTIYVAGGFGNNERLRSMESFAPSAAGAGWSTLPGLLAPRDSHILAAAGDGCLHAAGGDRGGSGSPLQSDSHEIFDPAKKQWRAGRAMPYGANTMGAATGPDGKVYIVGGGTWLATGGAWNELLVLDPLVP